MWWISGSADSNEKCQRLGVAAGAHSTKLAAPTDAACTASACRVVYLRKNAVHEYTR